MPTKKTTKATAKNSKDSGADNAPEDSNVEPSLAKETPSSPLAMDIDPASTPETDPKDSGQLFLAPMDQNPKKRIPIHTKKSLVQMRTKGG